jgi:phosphatidylglycerophosphate synthase
VVIVLARDVALVVGYKLVAPRGYELEVTFVGKLATWILYLGLFCVIVTPADAEWPLWIVWTGIGLALVAGLQYLVRARQELA